MLIIPWLRYKGNRTRKQSSCIIYEAWYNTWKKIIKLFKKENWTVQIQYKWISTIQFSFLDTFMDPIIFY